MLLELLSTRRIRESVLLCKDEFSLDMCMVARLEKVHQQDYFIFPASFSAALTEKGQRSQIFVHAMCARHASEECVRGMFVKRCREFELVNATGQSPHHSAPCPRAAEKSFTLPCTTQLHTASLSILALPKLFAHFGGNHHTASQRPSVPTSGNIPGALQRHGSPNYACILHSFTKF